MRLAQLLMALYRLIAVAFTPLSRVLTKREDNGVLIQGIGFQGHWSIYEPSAGELEESINKFAGQGWRKHTNTSTGGTFWNVSDKSSWLDNLPVPGRKNYPWLFD